MKLIRILAIVPRGDRPARAREAGLMDRSSFPSGYEAPPGGSSRRKRSWPPPCSCWCSLARTAAAARDAERRRRLRARRRPHVVFTWERRSAAAHAALPRRARGGAVLPPARRSARCGADGADPRGGRRCGARTSSATPSQIDSIVLRGLIAVALGGIVGRLVDMERGQARAAEQRAAEAERLRDELGRRIDVLEATGRAARALSSSLDLDVAFEAFVQELRGLAAVRSAASSSRGERRPVMATAGIARRGVARPGGAHTARGLVSSR